MDHKAYLKYSWKFPTLVAICLYMVYAIISDWDYESEWITRDFVFFLHFAILGVHVFINYITTSSIRLLNKEKFRGSQLNRNLIFLVPTLTYNLMVFLYAVDFLLKQIDDYEITLIKISYLLLSTPYIIGILYAYRVYRRHSTQLISE